MRLSTIIRGMRQKSLFASFRAMGALTPFYRLSFAASAFTCSLVRLLADGPVPFEKIASRLAKDSGSHGLLRAWLDLGVRVGELGRGARGYSLKGYSRMIAAPERDPHAALFQEALSLHHDLIMNTPGKCARGEKWRPEEHDGRLIARSSRLGEPVVMEAVDRTFPRKGKVRLLEIGCGSGVYIRHAAERNPSLTAVGIELSEQAAVYARDNIREWGLEGRVRIENADIRKSAPAGGFDVATLHNNIYYFAEETRTDLEQMRAEVTRFKELTGQVEGLLAEIARTRETTEELRRLTGELESRIKGLPEETLRELAGLIQAYLDSKDQ